MLKTLRDKEPFSRHGGIQKERVIVPWAGRRHWVMGVSGSDAPVLDGLTSFIFFPKPINRRAQSGLLLGLVHRFWTILGGILAGFIVLEQVVQGFHLWDSIQPELLKVAGKASSPGRACSHRAGLASWVLPGFRIVLDDVIYGTVEDHKPRGITGDNLR